MEAQIGWVSWQGGELTASTVGVISLCLLAGLLGVGSRLESSRSWAGEGGGCGGHGEEQLEVVVVMGMGCECSGGDGDGGVEVVVVIGRGWEEWGGGDCGGGGVGGGRTSVFMCSAISAAFSLAKGPKLGRSRPAAVGVSYKSGRSTGCLLVLTYR